MWATRVCTISSSGVYWLQGLFRHTGRRRERIDPCYFDTPFIISAPRGVDIIPLLAIMSVIFKNTTHYVLSRRYSRCGSSTSSTSRPIPHST